MPASLIIPVWNGAEVILDCLRALYAHSGGHRLEVIAVDNASADESARLIHDSFPHVTLLRQPINLGFAGGVNAGIDAARGEILILLNQDCLVQPGWLDAVAQALQDHPEAGIAGCAIFNADGSLNHAGAFIRHPEAMGEHLTDGAGGAPRPVEYVTGAAMAIRRSTWEMVGRFDEGFYPAYFEESDYCYRARCAGIDTWYVPGARVTHLFSSREWQRDPLKHATDQHRSRYRFVCKHFASQETGLFMAAELTAIDTESYLDQVAARMIAARSTLHGLSDILERRRLDRLENAASAQPIQLQAGFTQILRASFARAQRMILGADSEQSDVPQLAGQMSSRLEALRQREYDLLTRIYFRAPDDFRPEPTLHRLIRLLIKRPLSFICGREHLLLSELNAVHVMRQDELTKDFLVLDQYVKLFTDYDYR